jgi:hypothetical protein
MGLARVGAIERDGAASDRDVSLGNSQASLWGGKAVLPGSSLSRLSSERARLRRVCGSRRCFRPGCDVA